MKIFIGFGYNDNDKWIRDIVFPLVTCLGGEVVTGEDMHGLAIQQEVVERIKNSDGLLAFMTKRDGSNQSHPWVRDELIAAISNNVAAVEIREIGVEVGEGIPGNRQRINYNPQEKEKLVLELVKVLSNWKRRFSSKRMVLLPQDLVASLRPVMNNAALRCTYQFMDGSKETQQYEAKLRKISNALYVDVKNIPNPNALIQITITGPGVYWSSDYESVDMLTINLRDV
jgi:hypothetical protein